MGNSESKDEGAGASSPSATRKTQHAQHKRREPSRDSWRNQDASYNQGQGHAHASRYATQTPHHHPAPPTATAIAPSQASTSTSNVNVTHTITHTRTRSRTSVTSSLRASERELEKEKEVLKREDSMGASESKPDRPQVRPPSSSQTLPQPPAPPSAENEKSQKPAPSPTSQPVNVPHATNDDFNEKESFAPSGVPEESSFVLTGPRYDRPPRLPLPIEEDGVLHTPGSPIISPIDLQPTNSDDNGTLPRRTSILSTTTAGGDEDDLTDEFLNSDKDSLAPKVPTTLRWRGKADKIYVTGTFARWERKYKLHRDEVEGGFSAVVHLQPGTHHLKFLVHPPGDMTTSEELPTTVDYAGNFVNYIEVVAPPLHAMNQDDAHAEPAAVPESAGQATATATQESAARPMDIRPAKQAPETAVSGITAGIRAQDGARAEPVSTPREREREQEQERRPKAPPREKVPRAKYTNAIPAFLLDLDGNVDGKANEEAMSRAKRVEHNLPQPPTLPMFLGKSILNGNMPHKDDASVLLMPNHTVLNHLATSSIRHGVLATSGTTRYKRKFLTTIMYKPTASGD